MSEAGRERGSRRLTDEDLDDGIRAAFGLGAVRPATAEHETVLVARSDRSVLARLSSSGPSVRLRETADGGSEAPVRPAVDGELLLRGDHRYRILGEIARGGIGAILRARDVDLGREVALKVLLEEHRGHREMTERFLEEAQIGGQLEHPGIVPVHDIGLLEDERPYFAMKLIKGQTLAEALDERASLREERQRFLAVFEQVCQTLAYAHSKGVIHRDLKPSNIMVGAFGEVQVMDWGFAKVLGEDRGAALDARSRAAAAHEPAAPAAVRTSRVEHEGTLSIAGSIFGTPAYMSPEQARGAVDELDERSDVFGLGAILCEILTGKPPYPGKDVVDACRRAQSCETDPALERLASAGVEPELADLARDCLERSPDDRPRSAAVVSKRITSYLASLEARARALELRAARARARSVIALAVLIALALAVGAWWVVDSERRTRIASVRGSIDEAFAEAVELRARAVVHDDVSTWAAAAREASRAAALAREAGATELVSRAEVLSAELETEVRDRSMVAELDALRETRDEEPDELEGSYRDLFSEYGIAIPGDDPSRAASAISSSRIRDALVLGLDQWALATERPRRGGRETASQLFEIAQLADTDPWRRRLRRALRADDADALVGLIDEIEPLDAKPTALELLARALGRLRRDADAKRVWIEAQRLYPGDFWIQIGLAFQLQEEGRHGEALEYLRASVALRPTASFPRWVLASTLRELSRHDEALAQLRAAIELDPLQRGAPHFRLAAEILHDHAEAASGNEVERLRTSVERLWRGATPGGELRLRTVDLLARASVARGDISSAVRLLEESLREGTLREDSWRWRRGGRRSRDSSREPARERPREPARPTPFGSRGGRVGSTLELLVTCRARLAPELVSFASIDAVLEEREEGSPEPASIIALRESKGSDHSELRAYLDGRSLQVAGRPGEALSPLLEASAGSALGPEPFLHAAECQIAVGDAVAAERTARRGLAALGTATWPELWRLWARVAFVDLSLSAAEVAQDFPATGASGGYGELLRVVVERLGSDRSLAINCAGGAVITPDGTRWIADGFHHGFSFATRPFTGEVEVDEEEAVHRTKRLFPRPEAGGAGYRIPLPKGPYRVRLVFAGSRSSRTSPPFDVLVEGEVVRRGYTPPDGADGIDQWEVGTRVEDGALDVGFAGDLASISAIVIQEDGAPGVGG